MERHYKHLDAEERGVILAEHRRGNGHPGRFLIRLTLRLLRRGEPMFGALVGTKLIELVLAGGSALAQAKQAVGKLLAARHRPRTDGGLGSLGENGPDLHWAGSFQVAQEPVGIGGGLGIVDADEDPPCRPVDGHKQVAPRVQRENCPPGTVF